MKPVSILEYQMMDLRKAINNSFDGKLFMPQLNLMMNTSYAVSDDRRIFGEKTVVFISKRAAVLDRKNKNAVTKKQRKILQILQKNVAKLHVFNSQLSQMIDTIPDTLLLNDKEGRKFITNQLTKHFFKRHDLDWYGKSSPVPQKVSIDHQHELILSDSELLDALVKRQFKLYYQGQVDSDRQVLGAEVLLRWEHPRYGLLTANQFIPVAERTGLILPIGAWVLQMACRQLKQWQHDPLKKDLSITVNISLWQFSQFDFVDQLDHLLKKNRHQSRTA